MYVYILYCADDSFYTGVTNNLERRMNEHNTGYNEGSYTSSRRPLKLIHYEIFQFPNEAINREKQIKRWGRAKKIALINDDIDLLKELAKKSFEEE